MRSQLGNAVKPILKGNAVKPILNRPRNKQKAWKASLSIVSASSKIREKVSCMHDIIKYGLPLKGSCRLCVYFLIHVHL